MKIKLFIPLLLICLFTLSGCYDLKEIDETAYIVALGIDKGEDDGFNYTFQFSKPLAMQSGGGEKDKGSSEEGGSKEGESNTVSNLKIKAPDFYVAKNMTNNFLSKNVDMSHLKIIVFSKDINASDLEDHSQLLLREREVRPHTAIAVAADSAAGYLENVNPELESNTSKYYELLSLRSNNVFAPTKTLHDFVDEISANTSDTVLPIAVSGKEVKNFPEDTSSDGWLSSNQSEISSDRSVLFGMAIFKDGKLAHAMDGNSAMLFNILSRSIESCTITIRDKHNPDKTLSFRITIPEKASFFVDLSQNRITVSQELQVEFMGAVLPEGYRSFEELDSYVNKVLSSRISEFFTDLSRNKNADIMNIKDCLRKDFPTWQEWNSYDWKSFYKSSQFNLNIKFI